MTSPALDRQIENPRAGATPILAPTTKATPRLASEAHGPNSGFDSRDGGQSRRTAWLDAKLSTFQARSDALMANLPKLSEQERKEYDARTAERRLLNNPQSRDWPSQDWLDQKDARRDQEDWITEGERNG